MNTSNESCTSKYCPKAGALRYRAAMIRNDTIRAFLEVYVQPRASKTEVVGMHDGRIKIRLAAPPVDGAANAELVSFVASRLGVTKSKVRVVAGEASRRKVVEVEGVDAETLRLRMTSATK